MSQSQQNELLPLESFDDAFRGFLRPWLERQGEISPSIKIDLSETAGAYRVKADLPGVRKEDIDIQIDNNRLTLSATVKRESQDQVQGKVIRSERQVGYASRSLWLDKAVDEAKASARFENGVLELTLPQKPPTETRKIAVD
ncbi:Hsp20/alpha crystallin family protein [Hydrogenophaga sp.]|uniref:Hsp20/alpha crystallin family protein n=1 Tax=Hydrogenophaga sp. TaxID=1904254 RepID=UPI0035B25DB6